MVETLGITSSHSARIAAHSVERDVVEQIVRQIVFGGSAGSRSADQAPDSRMAVSISARHCHLTNEHVETLFGPGHTLTPDKELYQEGFFAAQESVMVVGPRRRMLPQVRVLGPTRAASQVELAFTDAISLGINVPVLRSGHLSGTPGCVLVGPAGVVELPEGVIRAERHVHMNHHDAEHYGVRNGGRIHLRIESACTLVLEDLLVRADQQSKLEVHIDTDEGNAADLEHAARCTLFV